jgi:uncharacterized membrane protein SpoIIM required for sporulation
VDLDAFVAEHTAQWRRLTDLSRRRRMTMAEADELVTLYQRAGSHLSAIRSSSPDPALVAYLSRIVLSARGAITGGPAWSWRAVGRFFTEGFPLAVYQARRWWIPVGVVFTALTVVLIGYIAGHPDVQDRLLPPEDAQRLASTDFSAYYTQYPARDFALHVWTNNALLTGQCLASGILIVPVLYLLFENLLNVGADGGFMTAYGRSGEFWGLIAPHGLLELTAVFVGAGVGLQIGWSWISPHPGMTRTRSVAVTARAAMLVALGLVLVLAVSGVIEAFVTPAPLPTAVRIAIGATVWAAFLGYVFVFGARAERAAASADLDPDLAEAVLPAV